MNYSYVFFCLFIFTAKAKLESQLESARTQELANGGQANDILKCVGFDFVLFLKENLNEFLLIEYNS